jgi:hypothetical protein
MSKQEEIYRNALRYKMPEHKFGNYLCIFYKGFKFEKEILDNGFEYRVYSTRSSVYKELKPVELDILLSKGIFEAASLFSYNSYNKLLNRYRSTSESKRSSYKTVEKAVKVMKEYTKRCEDILLRYPKLLED